jgi:chromosome partitioning protein
VTRVLATYSIKGGVGKTTTAVNLAYISASNGARTLLWDLDPQGAATYLFRIKPRIRGGSKNLIKGRGEVADLVRGSDFENLDLLPADVSYRHMDLHLDRTRRPDQRLARVLAPLRRNYEVILLDCPPSLSLVSESVFRVAATLIVPMIPAPLPTRTLDQLEEFLRSEARSDSKRLPRTLAFFTMVDRRRRLHRQTVDQVVPSNPHVLPTTIPLAAAAELMGVKRAPIETYLPHSAVACSYRNLWSAILEKLD